MHAKPHKIFTFVILASLSQRKGAGAPSACRPPACSHMPAGEAVARTASAARVQRLIKKDLLTSKIFLRRVIRWKRVYLTENICFTQLSLLQRHFDRRPSELGIRYEGATI